MVRQQDVLRKKIVVIRKDIATMPACKDGKKRNYYGRCVKDCKRESQERINSRCVQVKKKGYVFNRLSNRLVAKDGKVGKWMRGGRHPRLARGPTYAAEMKKKYGVSSRR